MSCQNVLSSQNLIPCFLTFCSTIESKFNLYLPFKFLIFYHSSIYIYIYIERERERVSYQYLDPSIFGRSIFAAERIGILATPGE